MAFLISSNINIKQNLFIPYYQDMGQIKDIINFQNE